MEIIFEQVNHIYQPNTPFFYHALKDISFSIPDGSFTAIIGHTGSGKSTLIQHLNGLLRPTSGTVRIGDFRLTNEKNKMIKDLRKNVGMVFQYPEHQLFEETVRKDILFGPKNFQIEINKEAEELDRLMQLVNLPNEVLEKSPFELSGGQMRRVAIASVLITNPSVLVLDEPTAGLDPLGKKQMMELFAKIHKERGNTTILITHDMEDALQYADQVIVLNDGRVEMNGRPLEVFKEQEKLRDLGLAIPELLDCLSYMADKLGIDYQELPLTVPEIVDVLVEWTKEGAADG